MLVIAFNLCYICLLFVYLLVHESSHHYFRLKYALLLNMTFSIEKLIKFERWIETRTGMHILDIFQLLITGLDQIIARSIYKLIWLLKLGVVWYNALEKIVHTLTLCIINILFNIVLFQPMSTNAFIKVCKTNIWKFLLLVIQKIWCMC